MKNEGPIMKGGVHPITGKSAPVIAKGKGGSERAAPPKEAQVAGAGAKHGAGAPKTAPVQKPEMKGKVAAAETVANRLYPKALGLRGQDP